MVVCRECSSCNNDGTDSEPSSAVTLNVIVIVSSKLMVYLPKPFAVALAGMVAPNVTCSTF